MLKGVENELNSVEKVLCVLKHLLNAAKHVFNAIEKELNEAENVFSGIEKVLIPRPILRIGVPPTLRKLEVSTPRKNRPSGLLNNSSCTLFLHFGLEKGERG